jgi:Xaa-Pro aminopeptidase
MIVISLLALLQAMPFAGTLLGHPSTGSASTSKRLRCLPATRFFHDEKESPPLPAGFAIAIGNCGIYIGPWGVRIEDTVLVEKEGPVVLTDYPYSLEPT